MGQVYEDKDMWFLEAQVLIALRVDQECMFRHVVPASFRCDNNMISRPMRLHEVLYKVYLNKQSHSR